MHIGDVQCTACDVANFYYSDPITSLCMLNCTLVGFSDCIECGKNENNVM